MTHQDATLGRFLRDIFDDEYVCNAFQDLDRIWEVSKTKLNFPPSNVSTNKDGTLILELALAGYEPEQIAITAEDGKLIVKGTAAKQDTKCECEGECDCEDDCECYPLWKGIKGSNFQVSFPIPSKFDISAAKAGFRHGMLVVKIPLAEERKPKSISIDIGLTEDKKKKSEG